jgi:Tautomerase enzyme
MNGAERKCGTMRHPTYAHIAGENYLGIGRTQDCVFIQLTLSVVRTVEQQNGLLQGRS